MDADRSPPALRPRRASQSVRRRADRGRALVELPGGDRSPWTSDAEPLLEAIREFVSDAAAAEPADDAPERVLSTVLFTDIVGGTERRPPVARAGSGAPQRG